MSPGVVLSSVVYALCLDSSQSLLCNGTCLTSSVPKSCFDKAFLPSKAVKCTCILYYITLVAVLILCSWKPDVQNFKKLLDYEKYVLKPIN